MRRTLLSGDKGFTLLEVVFAVGILAIGMLGYTALKISNMHSWVFAKDLSQAVQLTGANLERLLMAGYHDTGRMSVGDHSVTVNADGTHALVGGQNASGQELEVAAGDFTAGSVQWTVREKCPSDLTKMVTYTTNWNVAGNKSMNVTQIQVRP